MVFVGVVVGWILANHLQKFPLLDRAEMMVIVAILFQVISTVASH